MAHTTKIEGGKWELYEDEDGTYLHLYKDDGKIAISIGHPEDTMQEFLDALILFLEQMEDARVARQVKTNNDGSRDDLHFSL